MIFEGPFQSEVFHDSINAMQDAENSFILRIN